MIHISFNLDGVKEKATLEKSRAGVIRDTVTSQEGNISATNLETSSSNVYPKDCKDIPLTTFNFL